VVENQNPKAPAANPRGGWELLIRSQVIAGVTCPSREVVVNPFCNSPSLYYGGPEHGLSDDNLKYGVIITGSNPDRRRRIGQCRVRSNIS
jgi:hypothetical protein